MLSTAVVVPSVNMGRETAVFACGLRRDATQNQLGSYYFDQWSTSATRGFLNLRAMYLYSLGFRHFLRTI
jgi:hypothetical protein